MFRNSVLTIFLIISIATLVISLEPCACPRNYAPVCGSNNKEYPNECELNCVAKAVLDLTLKHRGACK